jgi:hypothetical protein
MAEHIPGKENIRNQGFSVPLLKRWISNPGFFQA